MIPYKASERGSALPTVIMVMLVIMTFAGIVLSYVTSETKSEVFFENKTAALHAAEAGLNMYLWDLNEDSGDNVALNTATNYPEYNPTAAYILTVMEDKQSKKVVQATGWMLSDPSVKCTVEGTFSKKSYCDYVYFTNTDSGVNWGSNDNVYGPLRTNGNLSIDGSPKFWDTVTYTGTYSQTYGSHPDFKKGKEQKSSLKLPNDDSALMNIATSDYSYDGRTSILLNSDGTMNVWNPKNNIRETNKPLPSNGVIYVNGTSNDDKFDENNGNVFIAGKLNGRLTVGASNDIYITGYDPTVYKLSDSTFQGGVKYKDTYFTMDVGRAITATIGGDTEADMLGLVATRNVAVLTRGWFDNVTTGPSVVQNFTIHAAVFAVKGKFGNSDMIFRTVTPSSTYPNPHGTLTVRGAIIQSIRGAVGLGSVSGTSSGYAKDYAHDTRLLYEQPPYFLEPSGYGWEIKMWKEIN